jgi:hypothetical protein
MALPGWVQLTIAIAFAKIALGIVGVVALAIQQGSGFLVSHPYLIYAAHMVVFAGAATFLIFGSRADRRAIYLAVTFLLIASAFSFGPSVWLAQGYPQASPVIGLLARCQLAALLPYFFWVFISDFPRVTYFGWSRRIPVAAMRVSLAIGALLLTTNLIGAALTAGPWEMPALVAAFERQQRGTLFWPLLFALVLPALVFAIWRARRAPLAERRRVRLLLAGLVGGSAPILLVVLAMGIWDEVANAILRPLPFAIAQAIVYPALLSIPLTTTYAVRMRHALDVRLVVRKALQYAMARYTVLAAALIPIGVFVILLYTHRDKTLVELVSGPETFLVAAAAALAVFGLAVKGTAMEFIDRRFFREHYDAQQIMRELVEGSRKAADIVELEQLLTNEVDRALRLEGLAFLCLDPQSDLLVTRTLSLRSLSIHSELAALALQRGGVVDVDPGRPTSLFMQLPREDRQWLTDGAFHLLVPLADSERKLIGLLALGDKQSELPFTAEDRLLLSSLASAAAVTLEERILSPSERDSYSGAELAAGECKRCGLLCACTAVECSRCGGPVSPSHVPRVLGSKFRIEERVGAGGMGVVYRGVDLNLGRDVAVKTLPRLAPFLAWRLRREARAMAAVTHPNLALIYGAESWNGTPMLIFEYLPGGNLAEKIEQQTLSIRGMLDLGIVLASVADRIHAAGILHRDIKPSNVGFTGDEVPKLLDLGLSRAIESSQETAPSYSSRRAAATTVSQPGRLDGSWFGGDCDEARDSSYTPPNMLVGTVAYLSPEAANGAEPEPSFDIWSICVLLYESLAGTNPFKAASAMATLGRIYEARIPDVRQYATECPATVATFFQNALSADRKRRPTSARALCGQLEALRDEVVMT